MKIKTSITLTQELLAAIDAVVDDTQNRSQFLEAAAWEYIARLRQTQLNQRDLEIINQRADYLNSEVADVLAYQIPL